MSERGRGPALGARLDGWQGEAFLHEWGGLGSSARSSRRARRVHCGNLEIQEQVGAAHPVRRSRVDAGPARRPAGVRAGRALGLLVRDGAQDPRPTCSGGCASCSTPPGAPTRSTSPRRTTRPRRWRTRESVFEEMHEIFPSLYFLGNLSDVAVYNQLREATFFAAFFPRGVRANNTTVAAAMETGAVVITNLDALLAPRVRPPGERDRHRALRASCRPTRQCLPACVSARSRPRLAAAGTRSSSGWRVSAGERAARIAAVGYDYDCTRAGGGRRAATCAARPTSPSSRSATATATPPRCSDVPPLRARLPLAAADRRRVRRTSTRTSTGRSSARTTAGGSTPRPSRTTSAATRTSSSSSCASKLPSPPGHGAGRRRLDRHRRRRCPRRVRLRTRPCSTRRRTSSRSPLPRAWRRSPASPRTTTPAGGAGTSCSSARRSTTCSMCARRSSRCAG